MKSKFISTEGEYLQAEIEINEQRFFVMDMFSSVNQEVGDIVDLDIDVGIGCDEEEWESIFSGNPTELKQLEHLSGWQYRAYGEITSIHPVIVDVGCFQVDGPIETNDARVIGNYIAFTILRLDASID